MTFTTFNYDKKKKNYRTLDAFKVASQQNVQVFKCYENGIHNGTQSDHDTLSVQNGS